MRYIISVRRVYEISGKLNLAVIVGEFDYQALK